MVGVTTDGTGAILGSDRIAFADLSIVIRRLHEVASAMLAVPMECASLRINRKGALVHRRLLERPDVLLRIELVQAVHDLPILGAPQAGPLALGDLYPPHAIGTANLVNVRRNAGCRRGSDRPFRSASTLSRIASRSCASYEVHRKNSATIRAARMIDAAPGCESGRRMLPSASPRISPCRGNTQGTCSDSPGGEGFAPARGCACGMSVPERTTLRASQLIESR